MTKASAARQLREIADKLDPPPCAVCGGEVVLGKCATEQFKFNCPHFDWRAAPG